MNLENLFQLDKEQREKLKEEGRIKYLPYGNVSDYFAILDGNHIFRKNGNDIYYIL